MAKVNFFEAFLKGSEDRAKPVFTIIVPGEEDPRALLKVFNLLSSGKVSFIGGCGDYESEDCE